MVLPKETISYILEFTPEDMMLLNKEYSEKYFSYILEHAYIAHPLEDCTKFNFGGSLVKYVKYIHQLVIMSLNFYKVDEINAWDDHITRISVYGLAATNSDVAQMFKKLLDKYQAISRLQCECFDSRLVFQSISNLRKLSSLTMEKAVPEIVVLNQMPNMKELKLRKPADPLLLSTIPPLVHITTLGVTISNQKHFKHFHRVFPKITKLSNLVDNAFIDEPYPESEHFNFDELSLKHLNCFGPFRVPKGLHTLTSFHDANFLSIPHSVLDIKDVTLVLGLLQSDIERTFKKALSYCESAPGYVRVLLSKYLIFSNKPRQPRERKFVYKTKLKDKNIYMYAHKYGNSDDWVKNDVKEIMTLAYVHEYTNDFIMRETDWRDSENDDPPGISRNQLSITGAVLVGPGPMRNRRRI